MIIYSYIRLYCTTCKIYCIVRSYVPYDKLFVENSSLISTLVWENVKSSYNL
jgi:hypothetical protein